MCLLTTFDQGFKNDGGVGGYLTDNLYDTADGSVRAGIGCRCVWLCLQLSSRGHGLAWRIAASALGLGGSTVVRATRCCSPRHCLLVPHTSVLCWVVGASYDSLFNIILLTVLLNIVFGIIIDTFAELREQKTRQGEDMANVCFICNIERVEFDRQGNGFEHHIHNDHYCWHYISLLAYVALLYRGGATCDSGVLGSMAAGTCC